MLLFHEVCHLSYLFIDQWFKIELNSYLAKPISRSDSIPIPVLFSAQYIDCEYL